MSQLARQASPAAALSFLAFDYGTRRVGVAVGNTLLGTARPLARIDAVGEARLAQIGRLIEQWRPDALVLGVPFHPDGAEHENTRRARGFGRRLRARFALAVHEVDERYSTTEARAGGATDDELDACSAAVILEQFLRTRTHPSAHTSAPAHTPPENSHAATGC